MARNRASMREGPLAELFRATEAAQRQAEGQEPAPVTPEEPQEKTVEHVPDFATEAPIAAAPCAPTPAPPAPPPVTPKPEEPAAAAAPAAAPPAPAPAPPAPAPPPAREPVYEPYEPPVTRYESMPEPAPRLEYAPRATPPRISP